MGTYASNTNVIARLPGRSITASSKPSTTQIDTWVAEAEAMVLGALAAASITAPVAGTDGGKIVTAWVTDYAEGRTRMAHAATGGEGSSEEGKALLDGFRDVCLAIRKFPGEYGPMLGATSRYTDGTAIRAPNMDTSADDYIAPTFDSDTEW